MSDESICVYWYRLEDGIVDDNTATQLMDEAERERMDGMRQPQAARFFAYRRCLLRLILSHHLGVPPDQLSFARELGDKPSLSNAEGRIHFNTSQTGSCGVVAVSLDGPVGVDVEVIRPVDIAMLAARILSPGERNVFQGLEPEVQLEAIFNIWTAKEALLKGLGRGLELGLLNQITTAMGASETQWNSVQFSAALAVFDGWQVYHAAVPVPFPQPAALCLAASRKSRVELIEARKII